MVHLRPNDAPLREFNKAHDRLGRFASGGGGGASGKPRGWPSQAEITLAAPLFGGSEGLATSFLYSSSSKEYRRLRRTGAVPSTSLSTDYGARGNVRPGSELDQAHRRVLQPPPPGPKLISDREYARRGRRTKAQP